MRILLASPAKQDSFVFREYLAALERLEVPDDVELDRYFVVNDSPELIPLIRPGEYDLCNTGDQYRIDDKTHYWSAENLLKMPVLRNRCIQKALEGRYDALWFVDTDVILQPDTLKWLLKAGKDIVAEIFWTRSDQNMVWCNCWSADQYTCYAEDVQAWQKQGAYQVGGAGACLLIRRRVLTQGVSYVPIPNIKQALRGEDRWFCVRAACAGFEIWVDTHSPATHLYTRRDYDAWMNGGASAAEQGGNRTDSGAPD